MERTLNDHGHLGPQTTPVPEETLADYVGANVMDRPVPITAPRPIPVEQRAAREWSTGRQDVTPSAPKRLLGPHPTRTRVLVTNGGPDTIYLGSSGQNATPGNGYALASGATSPPFLHRAEIWAGGPITGGSTAAVSYFSEYLDG
jgi:hypothetical protein